MYKPSVVSEFSGRVDEIPGTAAAIPSRLAMPRTSRSAVLRTATEFAESAATAGTGGSGGLGSAAWAGTAARQIAAAAALAGARVRSINGIRDFFAGKDLGESTGAM